MSSWSLSSALDFPVLDMPVTRILLIIRRPGKASCALPLWACSTDVAATLTPLDPRGKPAAPPNPVPPRCGRRRAAARSQSARAIAPPTSHRTSATATRDSLAHRAAGERSRLKTIVASTSADMARRSDPPATSAPSLREAGSSPRPDGLPGRRPRPLARGGRASTVASDREWMIRSSRRIARTSRTSRGTANAGADGRPVNEQSHAADVSFQAPPCERATARSPAAARGWDARDRGQGLAAACPDNGAYTDSPCCGVTARASARRHARQ
jgi:hypothetical protein